MLRNLLALRQIAQRTISTTSRRHFENKVPEKQKLFQEDNGMPVHLKGGASDALLYRACRHPSLHVVQFHQRSMDQESDE
ncbi:cytochrome c oxidase, subunit VIIa 2, isoform CRA_b [Mus musculus]|nr:cytochrome c oxidase, subunit VIIa 2, isoform CRA_b [Mus musculus]